MNSVTRPLPFTVLIGALLWMPIAGCSKRAENDSSADTAQTGAAAPDAAERSGVPTAAPTTADEPGTAAADTTPPIFELDAEKLLAMRLPEQQAREGWIRLFDGHTLYGWQMARAANWQIADEQVIVDAGEQSLLCTSLDWRDYELRLEFKADEQTNSGIFLRTSLVPEDPAVDCYELNIAPPENPFPTGSLVGRRKLEPAELGEFDHEAWHTYEVRVEGDTVTVRLDDRELYSWTDPMPLSAGRIAVQHNQGRIAFRNIMLRPLSFRPLLLNAVAEPKPAPPETEPEAEKPEPEAEKPDEPASDEPASEEPASEEPESTEAESTEAGADPLALWKQYPEMEGKFEIDDEGNLHVRGGLGQLETREEFADFALLAEVKTAGPKQNSGIFFRCIPGDTLMGYECQINNDRVAGDPLRPADCGTGGFFRRQDARIVAAGNDEWFTLMLVAHGAEMSAWVNGLQVSEWRDTRDPDPNPRRGQRLEAGTIMLQAHDPGTDVRFRALSIAPQDAPAAAE